MANVIRTMKDVDGNTVFPRTYAQAVTIGDGSVNLEGALSNRPEKPSLLPAKTTLADTDLVTIEGTGGVVNKMTVGVLKNLLGIAQGGIEQSGSNVNGNFIKYTNGVLICYITKTLPVFGQGGQVNFESPYPFEAVDNTLVVIPTPLNPQHNLAYYPAGSATSSISVLAYKYDGYPVPEGTQVGVSIIAIGRWK